MLKSAYPNLKAFYADLESQVTITSQQAYPVISTEFVRLNSQFVPFKTGAMRNAIQQQTDYTGGVVQGTNNYFSKRYYSNRTGKNNFYEYTAEKYGKDLAQKLGSILDKKL